MVNSKKPTYEKLEKRVLELEKAEAKHRETENKLRLQSLVLDQIQDRVTITDLKGIITYVNHAEVLSLGYEKDDLVGVSTEKYGQDPKRGITQREILDTTLEKGTWRGEITNYSADGCERILDCRTQVVKDENGDPVALSGIATDITEHKRIEKKAEHERAFLAAIIESIQEAIIICDEKGCIVRFNNAARRLHGIPEKPVPPERWSKYYDLYKIDGVTPLPMENIPLYRALKGEPVQNAEIAVIPKNTSPRYLVCNGQPLTDKNGKTKGAVCAMHDITDYKMAEQEKLAAQSTASEHEKYALVGKIAGKMAHDFNNILGGVMGNVQLATMECNESSVMERLKIILEQTQRGKNLTRNLVAFAKDQEPKQEFFSINEKIDLVLNLMKKDLEGIFVKKEYTSQLPELLADPGMMEHALVNIIQNSIHAVSLADHPVITIRTYTDNTNIIAEIEDNGCGIPDYHIEEIYEPAFTLKGGRDREGYYKEGIKGTGYGLANVKKYIEQHKGGISINTKVKKGTRISISIPVIKKRLNKTERLELRDDTVHFEKSILVVEDEKAISDVQYNILTNPPCNHKVDVACNGQEAVDMFDKNSYDLVSLDYILPGKISGMDIYKHIRKTDKTVPILFISGNLEFLESIKELKKSDLHIDHISKPCQNQDYIKAANGLFES
ncbi:MAG: PAS domain S-box protein [Desulfobacteraceae bacterium]